MNNPLITVFTPSYNREKLLPVLYKSLKEQSDRDFEWLIIDDGSTDNTGELVKKWIDEADFPIRYIYKQNGGLHTGYNTAIANMSTELSVCIDSDDALAPEAIVTIKRIWNSIDDKENIAGIIGMDYKKSGGMIGCELKENEYINAVSLMYTNGGDKKYVVRNDLLRTVAPMPVYAGEKNFNPHYMIVKLSKKYRFRTTPACLCIVDYQESGMSANIFWQYVNSPNSFAELRRAYMELESGLTAMYKYKNAGHYISSCILAREKHWLRKAPKKLITVLAIPLGLVITALIKYKTRAAK